jgi:hypothetical protein
MLFFKLTRMRLREFIFVLIKFVIIDIIKILLILF